VQAFTLRLVCLEKPDDHGECKFLHHFISMIAAGSFPKKTFFQLTLIKTDVLVGHKWVNSTFHTDLTSPRPAKCVDKEESPITLHCC
jgi:hypothetical protein